MEFKELIDLLKHTTNIDEFISEHSRRLVPVKPLFIISYGPPSSGKSPTGKPFKLTMKEIKYPLTGLSIKNDDEFCLHNNILPVNVDNIVNRFKSKIRPFLTKNTISNMEKDYLNVRSLSDPYSGTLLNYGLTLRYNILWETTGNFTTWMMKEISRVKELGYKTILYYPLVQFNTIIDRIKLRQKKTGQLSVDKNEHYNMMVNAIKNITKIIEHKVTLNYGPDEIYIFDNEKMNKTNLLFKLKTKLITEPFDEHFMKPRIHCEMKSIEDTMYNFEPLEEFTLFLTEVCNNHKN
jgi:hypothetical protein